MIVHQGVFRPGSGHVLVEPRILFCPNQPGDRLPTIVGSRPGRECFELRLHLFLLVDHPGGRPGIGQCRQENAHQDRDDRDHDEQFGQGEATTFHQVNSGSEGLSP